MKEAITALEYVQFDDRLNLPASPGVYLATKRSSVLYVGQSKNLRNRWKGSSHHQFLPLAIMGCTKIRYKPASIDRLDSIEKKLIRQYNPLLNSNGLSEKSSTEVVEKLRAIILKDYEDEKIRISKKVEERLYQEFKERLIKDEKQDLLASISSTFNSSAYDPHKISTLTLNFNAVEKSLIYMIAKKYDMTEIDALSAAMQIGIKQMADKAGIEIR